MKVFNKRFMAWTFENKVKDIFASDKELIVDGDAKAIYTAE